MSEWMLRRAARPKGVAERDVTMRRTRAGRALGRRVREAASGDEGSILPLILGYALLAITLVLVAANATSLYLDQRRLDAVADAAAVAGADAFTVDFANEPPVAVLTDEAVREQAALMVQAAPYASTLVAASAPGGGAARVTVTSTWHPIVFALFIPDGVRLESTATTRVAFN